MLATYGSKEFEDQCIRVYINKRCTQVPGSLDECSLAVHPEKNPATPQHYTCDSCAAYFGNVHCLMKKRMLAAQKVDVINLIKKSCNIGACKSGSPECGVCRPRIKNIRATTKEYFKLQRIVCHLYIKRVYGVPRCPKDNFDRIEDTPGAFYNAWKPFVGLDGKFECNYPALFYQMEWENAPELELFAFPHGAITQSSTSNDLKQVSQSLRHISVNVMTSAKDVGENVLIGVKSVSGNALSSAKSVSNNLVGGVKDGAQTLLGDAEIILNKAPLVHHVSSRLRSKTRSIMNKVARR